MHLEPREAGPDGWKDRRGKGSPPPHDVCRGDRWGSGVLLHLLEAKEALAVAALGGDNCAQLGKRPLRCAVSWVIPYHAGGAGRGVPLVEAGAEHGQG